jgi:hypothetical protein
MKRGSLLIATLFCLVLTGLVMPFSGKGYSGSRSTHRLECPRNDHPLASDAGRRYRQCQPAHWRACLMQH